MSKREQYLLAVFCGLIAGTEASRESWVTALLFGALAGWWMPSWR